MKKLLAILLLAACSPKMSPPSNPDIPVPVDTVWMPGKVVHDVVVQLSAVGVRVDSALPPYELTPSGGDDWPAAQAILNSTGKVRFGPGQFWLSHGLLKTNIVNGQFADTWFDIEGAADAQNAVSGYLTTLNFYNPQSFGIAFQRAKGAVIKNLYIRGPYTKASDLSQLQIDTLPYSGWQDGICRFSHTSPTAGIVEDPFSGRENLSDTSGMYPGYSGYYYSNMNQSGSTAVRMQGLCIENWPVGVLITAANQQNGENNNIIDCRIDQCASAIAFTQAQAKTNYVTNLMCWGAVHTIIDGVHYGMPHGDGATCPWVDGVNIAGYVHDYIEADTRAFMSSNKRVYGEGLFCLGFTGPATSRGAGAHFDDLQVDWQNAPCSPVAMFEGGGAAFTGGYGRFYNDGKGPRRWVLNSVGTSVRDMMMSGPPVVVQGQAKSVETLISNLGMYYDFSLGPMLSRNDYDSVTGGLVVYLTVDRSTFTGYFLTPDTANLTPYMLFTTAALEPIDSASNYHPITPVLNSQTIVGFFDHTHNDTVFLNHMGVGFHTGDECPIFTNRIKHL